MDGLISEQQQVEEIRKWLHENATSIIAGVLIGLAIIFGWRVWDEHRHGSAQQASAAYNQMIGSLSVGDNAAAVAQGEAIIARYKDTSYATFAALALARVKLEQGETTAAGAHLQWAVSNAQQPELRRLATLRLARVLLAEHKPDEAIKQLQAIEPDHYAAERAELLGDAWRAKGDGAQARSAYQQALAALGKDDEALRTIIGMKLDDLGGAPAREKTP